MTPLLRYRNMKKRNCCCAFSMVTITSGPNSAAGFVTNPLARVSKAGPCGSYGHERRSSLMSASALSKRSAKRKNSGGLWTLRKRSAPDLRHSSGAAKAYGVRSKTKSSAAILRAMIGPWLSWLISLHWRPRWVVRTISTGVSPTSVYGTRRRVDLSNGCVVGAGAKRRHWFPGVGQWLMIGGQRAGVLRSCAGGSGPNTL